MRDTSEVSKSEYLSFLRPSIDYLHFIPATLKGKKEIPIVPAARLAVISTRLVRYGGTSSDRYQAEMYTGRTHAQGCLDGDLEPL